MTIHETNTDQRCNLFINKGTLSMFMLLVHSQSLRKHHHLNKKDETLSHIFSWFSDDGKFETLRDLFMHSHSSETDEIILSLKTSYGIVDWAMSSPRNMTEMTTPSDFTSSITAEFLLGEFMMHNVAAWVHLAILILGLHSELHGIPDSQGPGVVLPKCLLFI